MDGHKNLARYTNKKYGYKSQISQQSKHGTSEENIDRSYETKEGETGKEEGTHISSWKTTKPHTQRGRRVRAHRWSTRHSLEKYFSTSNRLWPGEVVQPTHHASYTTRRSKNMYNSPLFLWVQVLRRISLPVELSESSVVLYYLNKHSQRDLSYFKHCAQQRRWD